MALLIDGNVYVSKASAKAKPSAAATKSWENAYAAADAGSLGVPSKAANPPAPPKPLGAPGPYEAADAGSLGIPYKPVISHVQVGKGNAGGEVLDLQNKLSALGYDTGGSDGIFGKKTAAAVREFQAANGLDVDGIIGPQTHRALDGIANPWEAIDAGSLDPMIRSKPPARSQNDYAAADAGSLGVTENAYGAADASSFGVIPGQTFDPGTGPMEPQVVQTQRYRLEGAFGGGPLEQFEISGGAEYLVETLDNGEVLVTRLKDVTGAIETGGRAGLAVYGGEHFELNALGVLEAGASITAGEGETFRLASKDDLQDFFVADLARQGAGAPLAAGPFGSIPGVGAARDWAIGQIPGIPDLPPAESTVVNIQESAYGEASSPTTAIPGALVSAGLNAEIARGTRLVTNNATGNVSATTYFDLSGAVNGQASGPAFEKLGEALGQDFSGGRGLDLEANATLAYTTNGNGSPDAVTLTVEYRDGDNLQVHNFELDVNEGTPEAVLDVLQAGVDPKALPNAVADLIGNTTNHVSSEQYTVDSDVYGAEGGIVIADGGLTYTVDSITPVG